MAFPAPCRQKPTTTLCGSLFHITQHGYLDGSYHAQMNRRNLFPSPFPSIECSPTRLDRAVSFL